MKSSLLLEFCALPSLTRLQLLLAGVALVVLRVVVGFHFYTEGTTKLRDGNFTSEYFLKSAKGPLAPMFHALLDAGDRVGGVVLFDMAVRHTGRSGSLSCA